MSGAEDAGYNMEHDPFDEVVARFQAEQLGSLSERVYAALRRAILFGDLTPGTEIREVEVAARLAISRTPLREALRRLEAEHLVDSTVSRPDVVRGISEHDALHIYEVLALLEPFAVKLAATFITDAEMLELKQTLDLLGFFMEREQWEEYTREGIRFHRILYGASKNPQLVGIIEMLREKTHRYRRFDIRQTEIAQRGYHDHALIFDVIASGDGDRAMEIMRNHIQVSIDLIRLRASDERLHAKVADKHDEQADVAL